MFKKYSQRVNIKQDTFAPLTLIILEWIGAMISPCALRYERECEWEGKRRVRLVTVIGPREGNWEGEWK